MMFEDLFDTVDGPAPAEGRGSPTRGDRFRVVAYRRHDEITRIEATGALDLVTTGWFAELLESCLRSTTSMLVVDLGRVTFLGVSAIEALLDAEQHARDLGKNLALSTGAHAVDRALQALDLTMRFDYRDPPAADPVPAGEGTAAFRAEIDVDVDELRAYADTEVGSLAGARRTSGGAASVLTGGE